MKTLISDKNASLTVLVAALGLGLPVQADDFYDALSTGKASLDVRTRVETVDQDGIDKSAEAWTIRTRLGYETNSLFMTKAFVEMEDVRVVAGVDDYAPETAGYPVIADPRSTELNQAYLSITPIEGLEIKPGRQRLILDNARFVGNVGWRQNEQTFDAFTVNYDVAGFALTAAYLIQVNGIAAKFDAGADDIIVNASYKFTDIGKLSAYYYGIDQVAHDSRVDTEIDTMGLRFAGKTSGDVAFHYTAEYASQDNNINNKSADYALVELGAGIKPITVFVGSELLGSDDGTYGFSTPLATKHAFNGWADKFLGTPAQGLNDNYIKLVSKVVGLKIVAVYHQFSADDTSALAGDDGLGSEMDFLLVKPFAKKYKVGIKYAAYSADDNNLGTQLALTDTNKAWVWAEMKF